MSDEAVSAAPVAEAAPAPEAPAAPEGESYASYTPSGVPSAEASRFEAALAQLKAAATPEDAPEAPAEAPAAPKAIKGPPPAAKSAAEEAAAAIEAADSTKGPPPAVKAEDQRSIADRQALAAERAALKAERDAWKAEQQELAEWRDLKKVGKYDFNKVLDRLQLTPEEITAQAIQGGQLSPAERRALAAEEAIKALEAKLTDKEVQTTKAQQAQAEKAFVSEIEQFVSSTKDHELMLSALSPADAAKQVRAVLENHYRQTGVALTYAQGADRIEASIEAQLEAVTKATKFQTKYGSKQAPAAPAKPQARTLSGTMAGATPPAKAQTESDRMAAALKLLSRG